MRFSENALALNQPLPNNSPKATDTLDAKTRTAFGASTGQDFTTIGSFHAATKTMIAFAFQVARLVSTFGGHNGTSKIRGVRELRIIAGFDRASQVNQRLAEQATTG